MSCRECLIFMCQTFFFFCGFAEQVVGGKEGCCTVHRGNRFRASPLRKVEGWGIRCAVVTSLSKTEKLVWILFVCTYGCGEQQRENILGVVAFKNLGVTSRECPPPVLEKGDHWGALVAHSWSMLVLMDPFTEGCCMRLCWVLRCQLKETLNWPTLFLKITY